MYLFRRVQQEINHTKQTSFVCVYQTVSPNLNDLIHSAEFNIEPLDDAIDHSASVDKTPDQTKYPGCVYRCKSHMIFRDDFNGCDYIDKLNIRIYNLDYATDVDNREYETFVRSGGDIKASTKTFEEMCNCNTEFPKKI